MGKDLPKPHSRSATELDSTHVCGSLPSPLTCYHLAGQRFERKATAKCLLTNESCESKPSAWQAGPSIQPTSCQGWRRGGVWEQPCSPSSGGQSSQRFPLKCESGQCHNKPSVSTETPAPVPVKEAADGRRGRHQASPRPHRGNKRNLEEMAVAARKACLCHFSHLVLRGKGSCSPLGCVSGRPRRNPP